MFAQNIDCVHVNDLPYFKGITYLPLPFHFVLFLFNVPVKIFTVMSGRSNRFLGIISTFWRVNVSCSKTQHGDLSEDRTPTSHSGFRHSTTNPPHCQSCIRSSDEYRQ